ncbi:NAD-dependent epimerase/dehydratase family protein [Chryseolinea lacunae]|uniref:NAD-dependent epimerase/dehydratase family protein n=1 Tax=Chryseolinea lacunae TaxID=2801331 RepID=A0ABS1KT65_9BACT|nr:NAD-dependent epimerase/dehydratase family protein [Chryseolinea lacunae]MBL0742457.1 NAD-dependent epimerase/dehydratase family protein [Chryseolinea lacunae]
MKILIIGSKGFIGSHALHFFSTRHETWGCDVFTDYNEENFFLIDTLSPSYHSLFQKTDFDVCINCAGAASVPDSLKHPERDYELNTHLVFKLLNSIRQFSPSCKFINISSAAVYGNPKALPIVETQSPAPVSPYGMHKLYAEQLCDEFARHFKVHACSLRVFSAYGPGLRKQIFWDLFLKARKSNRVELFGTGEETRDYIYVSDIVSTLNTLVHHAPCDGESYNVASGKSYTLKEIASHFYTCLGWDGTLTFSGQKRAGDPDFWEADISKLKGLGFVPQVTIEEGIKKYAEWVSSVPLD